jgi:prepilin-type N-terminal cleavage/methylation domain-containing protein
MNPGRRAFTLLELILVLMVLGLMTALAAARLGGLRTSTNVDLAVRQVVDQARRCQRLATSRGQAVRLRLDLDNRMVSVQMHGSQGLQAPPDGLDTLTILSDSSDALTATFIRADGVATSTGVVDLMFLPDAVCDTPGLLTIACRDHRAAMRFHLGARPPGVQELLP